MNRFRFSLIFSVFKYKGLGMTRTQNSIKSSLSVSFYLQYSVITIGEKTPILSQFEDLKGSDMRN